MKQKTKNQKTTDNNNNNNRNARKAPNLWPGVMKVDRAGQGKVVVCPHLPKACGLVRRFGLKTAE